MELTKLGWLVPVAIRKQLRGPWNRLLCLEQRVRERIFYKQFIKAGDLVFDIGANKGEKTAALLSLGTRVVAVEPNEACIAVMERDFCRAVAKNRLHIERAAAAAEPGTVALTTFDSVAGMSSGSPEFLDHALAIGYVARETVTVRAITLDELISRHGLPAFIKIDVEGMDADVLRGLSAKPTTLSFEYNTAPSLAGRTRSCFDECRRLGFKFANVTDGVAPRFLFDDWKTLDQIGDQIEEWIGAATTRWGDVVAR